MSERQAALEEAARTRIERDLTWLWEHGGYTAEDLWVNLLEDLIRDFRDIEASEKADAVPGSGGET